MAFPCDAWTKNTVRQTDQVSACLPTSALAPTYELPEETFLAVVLDALQRLAVGGVGGFVNLSNYNPCDGDQNANNARCKFMEISLPVQTDATQQKQQILYMLGRSLCANNL